MQAALLVACLGLGVEFGPFSEADRPIAVLVGMLAVAAMATQNAVVQLDPPLSPHGLFMANTAQNMVQLLIGALFG